MPGVKYTTFVHVVGSVWSIGIASSTPFSIKNTPSYLSNTDSQNALVLTNSNPHSADCKYDKCACARDLENNSISHFADPDPAIISLFPRSTISACSLAGSVYVTIWSLNVLIIGVFAQMVFPIGAGDVAIFCTWYISSFACSEFFPSCAVTSSQSIPCSVLLCISPSTSCADWVSHCLRYCIAILCCFISFCSHTDSASSVLTVIISIDVPHFCSIVLFIVCIVSIADALLLSARCT